MTLAEAVVVMLAIIGACCLAFTVGGLVEKYLWMKDLRSKW